MAIPVGENTNDWWVKTRVYPQASVGENTCLSTDVFRCLGAGLCRRWV